MCLLTISDGCIFAVSWMWTIGWPCMSVGSTVWINNDRKVLIIFFSSTSSFFTMSTDWVPVKSIPLSAFSSFALSFLYLFGSLILINNSVGNVSGGIFHMSINGQILFYFLYIFTLFYGILFSSFIRCIFTFYLQNHIAKYGAELWVINKKK